MDIPPIEQVKIQAQVLVPLVKVLLPGAGHWIQQERPAEVNRLLVEFLAGLAT